MREIHRISLALGLFLVRSSLAQLQGMICHSCTDVSSPEHCQQTIECGQGEICYTREFIDHNGLYGFHLGCEDNRTCELLHEAQTLFGKRDRTDANTAPLKSCYQCCSIEECNNQLCQESSTTSTSPTETTHNVTCMSCEGVESPEHCRQTTVCGSNERCSLFLNAKTMFGKRHIPEPASPEECYDCCSSHECNIRLCQEGFVEHSQEASTTQSTTVTVQSSHRTWSSYTSKVTKDLPTTTVFSKGCPGTFVAFKDNCYVIYTKVAYWSDARRFCKGLGADLLSVHSTDENNFLLKEMRSVNEQDIAGFWTGGISSKTNMWSWVDGSPFNYTNWFPDYPHTNTKYIVMGNPTHGYPYARMWTYDDYFYYGFICKKSK